MDVDDLLGDTPAAPITLGTGETPNFFITLKDVMIAACPAERNGQKPIPFLAGKMGCSPQGAYAIASKERITYQRAKLIVEIGEGRVNIMDFEPYLI